MLKLCLANAIFVINYPRKKNCSGLYSTTYLPCHLLPVGVSHLLGLIPGKQLYTSYMFYAYLLSVKLDHDQFPSSL